MDKKEELEPQDYNPELDAAVKRLSRANVKVLTLKDINGLRQNRDIKRKEIIDDVVLDAALYEEPPEPQSGGLGM